MRMRKRVWESKIEAAVTGWKQREREREREELEPRESSCFQRETLLRPLNALSTTLIVRLSKLCLDCVLVMNTVSKIIIIIIIIIIIKNIFPARHSTNMHVAISQACPCTTLTGRPLSHELTNKWVDIGKSLTMAHNIIWLTILWNIQLNSLIIYLCWIPKWILPHPL